LSRLLPVGVYGVSLYRGPSIPRLWGCGAALTPEEIKSITLHRISAAFHRYFQTGGEALRELQERRKTLTSAGNELVTKSGGSNEIYVFDFNK